jgi:hypothetical protein
MAALEGQTPAMKITGDSFLAEFGFYGWVWFLPQTGETERLARFLGPSINVGPAMCGLVLTEKGMTQEGTSIWPMSAVDNNDPAAQKAKEEFTVELNKKLKMHESGLKAGKDAGQSMDELEETPILSNMNISPWLSLVTTILMLIQSQSLFHLLTS